MEENDQAKIIAFDTIFTTNHIQILKILLAYIDPSRQKHMAVCIKLLELQYTLSFFKMHPASALQGIPHENTFDAAKLCNEIFPLCSRSEQTHIKQMREMYQNVENLQEMMQMMQMMQMMKEMFPEGTASGGDNCTDFMSILSGMSGISGMPDLSDIDLSQIFEMLNSFGKSSD